MIRLFPAAKINLGLRILGSRPDGYHELSSLLIPLPGLHDILDIEEGDAEGLELKCDCDAITDSNILQKTYELFGKHKSFFPRLRVRLEKKIPVGAGLGGGSSDAAYFLRYLANLYPAASTPEDLISLGMKIGADVPFFLVNKPAQISGLGELVDPLKCAFPKLHLVLVWPKLHISTKLAFQAYDRAKGISAISHKASDKKDLTKTYVKATHFFLNRSCRLQDILSNLHNDLEGALFQQYPLLEELKQNFLGNGALASAMSGSGSSIYGIFANQEKALTAAAILRNKYKTVYQITT